MSLCRVFHARPPIIHRPVEACTRGRFRFDRTFPDTERSWRREAYFRFGGLTR